MKTSVGLTFSGKAALATLFLSLCALSPFKAAPQKAGPTSKKNFFRLSFSTDLTAIALSPDGKILACASEPKRGKNWPAPVYVSQQEIPTAKIKGIGSDATCSLSLWNVRTKKLIRRQAIHTEIRGMQFTPDGKLLVCGGQDNSVPLAKHRNGVGFFRFWDVKTGKLKHTIYTGLTLLAFSPNGRYYAMDTNGGIDLYDTKSWRRLKTFNWDYPLGIATEIHFSPDSQQVVGLATGREGSGSFRIWDVKSGRILLILGEDNDYNISGKISPNIAFLPTKKFSYNKPQRVLVNGGYYICVIETRGGFKFSHFRRIIKGQQSQFIFSIGHPNLAIYSPSRGGYGPTFELWNIDTKKKLDSWYLPTPPGSWLDMAFSDNGKKLAFSSDKSVLAANITNLVR
ncbi:hypothetical protein IAD21_03076 [Abditibacteriota bacterium]|nr:hypothetical protein IAD21_03076 [Abditibacteriota bacterium]